MVLWMQILGLLFGLFMAYYTFIHFKRGEFSATVFIFWLLVWLAFIIIGSYPAILDPVVQRFQFSRKLDLLTVLGFMVVTAVSFYSYLITQKNRRRLEELVSRLAKEEKDDKE